MCVNIHVLIKGWWLCLAVHVCMLYTYICVQLNYMFIIEVIVKGGVIMDCIILRGFSHFYLPDLHTDLHTWGGQNVRNTSYIMQSSTTAPLTATSVLNHEIQLTPLWECHQKTIIIFIIKVDFMSELLYWITLDCTGVPDEVDTECIFIHCMAAQWRQHAQTF